MKYLYNKKTSFVKKLTSAENAIDEEAKKELAFIRKKLLPLTYYQFPYSKYSSINSKWNKSAADYLKLSILFIPGMFSKPVFDKLERSSVEEWEKRKNDNNGSEMFLFFKR
jgi:hypothetical protein